MAEAGISRYCVKSAFQAFYLGVFGWAVWSEISALLHGANPIVEPLLKLLPEADFHRTEPYIQGLQVIFFIAFALHLLRIYITLELMEEEYETFSNFFDRYGHTGRVFDFLARVTIVTILTLKVFQVKDFSGFLGFILYFYSALVAWGLLAWIVGGKSLRGESFLVSSGCGLLAALFLMSKDHQHWVLLLAATGLATGLLTFDVLASRNNLFKYTKMFAEKWLTRW